MNPLKDPRRVRFLDRFDARYKSDVANCFFRVIREKPDLDDNEVCRQVWLNLKERSAFHGDTLASVGPGSGTTPFATFASVARDNPDMARSFCRWAREWETLSPADKDRVRGKGGAHA